MEHCFWDKCTLIPQAAVFIALSILYLWIIAISRSLFCEIHRENLGIVNLNVDTYGRSKVQQVSENSCALLPI